MLVFVCEGPEGSLKGLALSFHHMASRIELGSSDLAASTILVEPSHWPST